MTRVSCGICMTADGRVLVCKRGEGRKNAHLWEFPGGKQEMGESAEACLHRELMEELSLPVADVRLVCTDAAQGVTFDFLTCTMGGNPVPTEHEAIALLRPRELLTCSFCPADTPVARRMALNDPPVRAFFWDFDGTIMDTYPFMTACFCRACEALGIAAEPGRVLALMKDSLGVCCHVCGEESGISEDTLLAAFRREEATAGPDDVQPVDGIPEVLRAMKALGGRHYLVTHRDETACRYLRWAGLDGLFDDMVLSTDGFPRKPAPDSLLHLLDKHAIDPASAVMIGDRPLDTLAGRNAGMLSCLLDEAGRFPDAPCDLRVSTASALTETLCPEGLQ